MKIKLGLVRFTYLVGPHPSAISTHKRSGHIFTGTDKIFKSKVTISAQALQTALSKLSNLLIMLIPGHFLIQVYA
jgi:hypothetical protein